MTSHRERRAVITGMGLVSPKAAGVEEFWRALVAGESFVSPLPDDIRGQLRCSAAATVDAFMLDKADPIFVKRPRGRIPLFVQYALAAAAEAVRDANLDPRSDGGARFGIVMGNGSGGFPYARHHLEVLRERGPARVDPQVLAQMIPNVLVGHLAGAFGARGYNNTIVAACASGTQAIGEAARAVREGLADVVLAGGSEAWITEIGLITFAVLGALSTWTGDPGAASRPFDKDRSGFVPAEGAAVLVIEERNFALERGASVLAEISGYASTNDAYHLVAPDPAGHGGAECIKRALADAGVAPAEVDYVNAHGTATVRGDISETRAVRLALGRHAETTPLSATKSMIGHGMGASGALEVVACVQTILRGVIHPTINLHTPDPECDLDYVPGMAREASVSNVLKDSFGFGGHNACLVITRHIE